MVAAILPCGRVAADIKEQCRISRSPARPNAENYTKSWREVPDTPRQPMQSVPNLPEDFGTTCRAIGPRLVYGFSIYFRFFPFNIIVQETKELSELALLILI